jgi:hypothetical protein
MASVHEQAIVAGTLYSIPLLLKFDSGCLAGKFNRQFSQLHYGLWGNLLMKPIFVTL